MANVVTALGSASWESQFISSISHPMFDLSIVKRCVDGVDLIATLRTIDVDAVVVTDGLLRVDAHCVAEVMAAGARFIAITSDHKTWANLGVVDIVEVDDDNFGEMVQQVTKLVREDLSEQEHVSISDGKTIAVIGFGGASGRTTCSLELAKLLKQQAPTCLIDADMYAPSLAQTIGHKDFTGGLLELTRITELHKLSELSLHETVAELDAQLFFLRGIPTVQRWIDFRVHALREMWQYLNSMVDFSVVDCGPIYDVVELQSEITSKPNRGLPALTAIDAAETVVVTSNATEVGITRLISGVNDIYELLANKDVIVVVHGIQSDKDERDIRITLARELGVPAIVCIRENSSDYIPVANLVTRSQEVTLGKKKAARRGIVRKRAA